MDCLDFYGDITHEEFDGQKNKCRGNLLNRVVFEYRIFAMRCRLAQDLRKLNFIYLQLKLLKELIVPG